MKKEIPKGMVPMKVTAVIPARYGSTRFEGKPLADILGKPMIRHVYERVSRSRLVRDVIVATDDQRIYEAVREFGGHVVMTDTGHPSGTDRVAEVAERLKSEIILNVQGDEPLIRASLIDKAVRPLLDDRSLMMATLMTRLKDVKDWLNPNVVKVVTDRKGMALYFSRSPIPFPRDFNIRGQSATFPGDQKDLPGIFYKHIGVYVYRREFLLKLSRMQPTPLEKSEKLEQLRVLENGFRIKVVAVNDEPPCVDTPEDLRKVLALLSSSKKPSKTSNP
jgi:3-deoxy-manno-octulosonate cytidylyltransferase (CMP-KDO synthetase)